MGLKKTVFSPNHKEINYIKNKFFCSVRQISCLFYRHLLSIRRIRENQSGKSDPSCSRVKKSLSPAIFLSVQSQSNDYVWCWDALSALHELDTGQIRVTEPNMVAVSEMLSKLTDRGWSMEGGAWSWCSQTAIAEVCHATPPWSMRVLLDAETDEEANAVPVWHIVIVRAAKKHSLA